MQSYQVFINEHLILLTEGTNSLNDATSKNSAVFDSILTINLIDSEQLKLIVEWLFNEEEAIFKVVIPTTNKDEILQVFIDSFKLIEAAGGLVTNESGELLMIYRLNKWDLPKGKIEVGEEPKEAAKREVEEECGISNLEILEESKLTYHMYDHKDEKILKRTYWYPMLYQGKENLTPQLEESIELVKWISQDDLRQKIKGTYASLKSLLEKYLS